MQPSQPITQELLLVGAGAAHLGVLRDLARRGTPPGLRVTLLAAEAETLYSGMLPGLVAGRFAAADCIIDIAALARAAGVRFLRDEACGLDARAARLSCAGGRPSLRYDLLSIAVGAGPPPLPGAAEHAMPLRPFGRFVAAWEAMLARAGADRLRLVIVGAGAAGVELALAFRQRLGPAAGIDLLARGDGALAGLAPAARRVAERALAAAGVALHRGAEAVAVERAAVRCADGRVFPCDAAVPATGAAPPDWFRRSGLALCPRGFIAVDAALRSLSDPRIFAAGDCASVLPHPRPRAGVFAVRQAPALARNLRRVLSGARPLPFRPQRHWLGLLLAGPGRAIAIRGPLATEGRWALALKDRIDRRWIRSHREMRSMRPAPATAAGEMRCGGCGAKLPAAVLARVLAALPGGPAAEGAPDDAALVPAPAAPGGSLVQTVDLFRAPVEDPWLFGRIAANHALGDVAAMGAEPRIALAIAALPPAAEAVLEADLHAMLLGGQSVLEAAGARLAGGHSAEAQEALLGFAITGEVPAAVLRRSGLRAGDALVLTKPLGTGVVLAGSMAGRGRTAWQEAALEAMQASPFAAARVLRAHGASACADVTGFGLLNHLAEMLDASGVGAALDPLAVPALPGALELLAAGVASTMHPANRAAAAPRLDDGWRAVPAGRLGLLLDPQTAGGLLAGVPAERARRCVEALRMAGCPQAALIGTVRPGRAEIRAEPGTLSWR